MSAKQRILLVTRNYPPLTGGIERLLYNTCAELRREYDLFVVGPTGCETLGLPDRYFPIPPQPLYRFLLQAQLKAYALAKTIKPDLVISGSGLTAPAAWFAARRAGAAKICYLHGLDLVVRNRIYQTLFVPLLRRFDVLVVNSKNTAQLATARGIDAARIENIYPGVSLPDKVSAPQIQQFLRDIGAQARPVILSVGRLTDRKGLTEFVDRCLPEIVKQIPAVLLVVIGKDAAHAARANIGIADKIKQTALSRGVDQNVLMLGEVDDQTLSVAYAASKVVVFPALDQPGDVEGFGMVAIEAAARGVPTVAFGVGGLREAVANDISGTLIAAGDYDAMAAETIRYLQGNAFDVARCTRFASGFSWTVVGEQVRALCRRRIEASRRPST